MGKGISLVPPALNGNVYAATIEVEFLQQKCQFGMYYRQSGGAVVTQVAIGYNAIQLRWLNVLKPLLAACLATQTKINDIRIWCMRWPDQATGIFGLGATPGTNGVQPLPPQIALVLTKRTNLRGSAGRGRMYLCGMSEEASDSGKPNNAFFTAVAAFTPELQNSWIDPGGVETYTPCVVSLKQYALDRVRPPVPPELGPQPQTPPIPVRGGDIISIQHAEIWNTQRRRTIGKGQ